MYLWRWLLELLFVLQERLLTPGYGVFTSVKPETVNDYSETNPIVSNEASFQGRVYSITLELLACATPISVKG